MNIVVGNRILNGMNIYLETIDGCSLKFYVNLVNYVSKYHKLRTTYFILKCNVCYVKKSNKTVRNNKKC